MSESLQLSKPTKYLLGGGLPAVALAWVASRRAGAAMPGDIAGFTVLWTGMMAEMMLPAVTPVVLIFVPAHRGARERAAWVCGRSYRPLYRRLFRRVDVGGSRRGCCRKA